MGVASLPNVFLEDRSENPIVAWRGMHAILFNQMRHDIAVAAAHLKNVRVAALLCQDSYNFCVGFFGLLHANARILLLPQNQSSSAEPAEEPQDLLIDDAWIKSLSGKAASLQPLDPTQNILDVFTSGSTGLPQKVSKTLGQLEKEILVLESIWGTELGNGAVYATVPHHHIYGLTFKLMWPLAAGRPFTSETYLHWEDLTAALQPDAILISSPAHLSRLAGIAPVANGLKAIFTAGAPLSKSDAQQAEAIFFCAPTEIFGSTETGAIAARKPATEECWRSLPGIAIRSGENQALCLRSPFAGSEWVETKDRIEEIPGGFRFLGRTDTIVKIEGKRVSLIAVERILMHLDEIDDASVVLLPGPSGILAAAVKLSVSGKAELKTKGAFYFSRHLRQRLLGTVEAASVPRLWRFVDYLPTLSLGKRRAKDIIALFDEAP